MPLLFHLLFVGHADSRGVGQRPSSFLARKSLRRLASRSIHPRKRGRSCQCAGTFDPSRLHAEMSTLHHHADPAGRRATSITSATWPVSRSWTWGRRADALTTHSNRYGFGSFNLSLALAVPLLGLLMLFAGISEQHTICGATPAGSPSFPSQVPSWAFVISWHPHYQISDGSLRRYRRSNGA